MKRPDRADVLVFSTASDFRAWLEEHHATDSEAWIGYYRKGVPKTSQTYDEAVDQALCFGWIDGITYRVDDEVTTNRFTPRRKGSYWSAINIAKVERLKAAGQMADAGLRAFNARDTSAKARYSYENRPSDLSPEMLARLNANETARAYWEAQTASYRRAVAFWVMSAKQEATRERRLAQLIADCEAQRPIKSMAYGRSTSSRDHA
jgi:uncharacterized protein YdeI (YjbR/CyaY-like superfamily)